MSFDVAPTLLSWLEARDAADLQPHPFRRPGQRHRDDVSSRHLAAPFTARQGHANCVGAKSLRAHFGRKADGLWLPDMAVDDETLDVLAECGVEFTLLSSEQIRGDLTIRGGAVSSAHGKRARDRRLCARPRAFRQNLVRAELAGRRGHVRRAATSRLARTMGCSSSPPTARPMGTTTPAKKCFCATCFSRSPHAGYQVVPLSGFLRDHPPQGELTACRPVVVELRSRRAAVAARMRVRLARRLESAAARGARPPGRCRRCHLRARGA